MKIISYIFIVILTALVLFFTFDCGYQAALANYAPVTTVPEIEEYYDIDTLQCRIIIPSEIIDNIVLRDLTTDSYQLIDSVWVSESGTEYEIFELDTIEYDDSEDIHGS